MAPSVATIFRWSGQNPSPARPTTRRPTPAAIMNWPNVSEPVKSGRLSSPNIPNGLYATLARGQLSKIAAEEARVAATAKAQSAAEEKDRLAAAGAQQTEQAKAASQAKAAEETKVAAEKAKQIEQAKLAAAEQARLVAENPAPEPAAEEPKQQLAALPPPSAVKPEPSPQEITRSVQGELKRVGCFGGAIDGEWTAASRRALEQFNNRAGVKLNAKLASLRRARRPQGKILAGLSVELRAWFSRREGQLRQDQLRRGLLHQRRQ